MQSTSLPESTEEQIHLQAQLLNAVEQAILAVDLTGRIIFWNRFAERLYGWTEDEVHGRNIAEVLAAPQLLESARAHMGQLRRGEGWSGEFLVQRRDGTTFTAHVSGSLIQAERRTLISIVGVARDSTEHPQIQEANRLLAAAGARLVDAADYDAPLATLAQLAVPQIADWCVVHRLQADGSFEQVALAPGEMAKRQAAHDWLQDYLSKDDTNGLPAVLRSGESKLVPEVGLELPAAAAAIKSYMIVPLIVPPRTFGAITFVAAESGRRFDLNALALAENLASHIAVYVEKVRLYRESQRLNTELEQSVSLRTAKLREVVDQLKQSEATIQTLFRISNTLNATLEVDTILDELALEGNGLSAVQSRRRTQSQYPAKLRLTTLPGNRW